MPCFDICLILTYKFILRVGSNWMRESNRDWTTIRSEVTLIFIGHKRDLNSKPVTKESHLVSEPSSLVELIQLAVGLLTKPILSICLFRAYFNLSTKLIYSNTILLGLHAIEKDNFIPLIMGANWLFKRASATNHNRIKNRNMSKIIFNMIKMLFY